MNVGAFAKITHLHEAILASPFIFKDTVARLVLTFIIADANSITFHQLDFVAIIVGQHFVVLARADTNVYVIASTCKIVALLLTVSHHRGGNHQYKQ